MIDGGGSQHVREIPTAAECFDQQDAFGHAALGDVHVGAFFGKSGALRG